MKKYVIYALMVTFSVTTINWTRMIMNSGGNGASSGWTSRTGSGGGSYGGGSGGGGGHK